MTILFPKSKICDVVNENLLPVRGNESATRLQSIIVKIVVFDSVFNLGARARVARSLMALFITLLASAQRDWNCSPADVWALIMHHLYQFVNSVVMLAAFAKQRDSGKR